MEGWKRDMIVEFVPANEKAKARLCLMELKFHRPEEFEDHVTRFEDMITLCDTPVNEG